MNDRIDRNEVGCLGVVDTRRRNDQNLPAHTHRRARRNPRLPASRRHRPHHCLTHRYKLQPLRGRSHHYRGRSRNLDLQGR